MQTLFSLIVAAFLVVMATADYDEAFCRKYLDKVDDSSTANGIRPVFYDNFYLFMERKDILQRSTLYLDEYYSEQAEMIYGSERGKVNQSQFWVDATTNEILTGPTTTSVCLDSPLLGSTIAEVIGVNIDATGDVTLSTPEVALGWHKKYQIEEKYLGEDTARGIKTVKWTVCSFNPQTQITAVTDWYIVDPTEMILPIVPAVQTAGQQPPVLPIYAQARGINWTNPLNASEFAVSIDFTFYDSIQPNDPVFQIPPTMICQTKPSAQKPLPIMPPYFSFKGEQIIIYNPNSNDPNNPPSTDITYTVEEYIHELNLFVQDSITSPSAQDTVNDKNYQRTVNDYNIGLSYNFDLETGNCYASDIAGGIDAIALANGKVQLRNSQQFFDLDSTQYQYMGVHKMRGIDCDTWSAHFDDSQSDHDANTLYTWYFATSQWLTSYGYANSTQPMPIALEVQSDDLQRYVQFNFYEFDTQDNAVIPDLSLCFNENNTWNLQINISASYAQIKNVSTNSFRRALFAAILSQTSLESIVRVSRLNVQPLTASLTLVQFKLFDTSNLPTSGDVVNAKPGVPNLNIFCDINNLINSGTFSIDVPVTAADNSMTIVSYKVQPNSLAIFGRDISACSTSQSGYSAGAMAGIAFGMLFLGILLSIGGIFAFYRFRNPGIAPNVDKKRIDEESAT